MATAPIIPAPPQDIEEIQLLDNSLVFPAFTAQTAWALGCLLRTKLQALDKPAIVDISLVHGNHCLFHCATQSGTSPDNDSWVERKRNTVLRWGTSTWYMSRKFMGDYKTFAEKTGLGIDAARYAIHGGGWPVRVRGVEGVVAVVVVSGLKQDQDHAIIVQTVGEMLEELSEDTGEKRKED
ncbi:hypothetical protein BDY17DRAFT_106533 [Neohortaea acidophila]|uniref:DUF967 domain protein n=1 Tax=Neohortaea acidophila TaxID=245834 RepID=A0A6A6Q0N5_9PEZI|nr:uncharacterized protein BDY17DRAFT_106533 [Neohortaea acidophila]KAF2485554.1 hypothetical protein BDY17DRAFT_106533 [Neohortaea acidophila]